MSRRMLSLLVILALLTPVLIGCMGEGPEERDLAWLLRKGKEQLEQNDGSKAYNYFRQVIEIDPNHVEGLYGAVLSLDLRVFAFLNGIIDLMFGVELANPTIAECRSACEWLEHCGFYDMAWTDAEHCVEDCPWGLQPFMFQKVLDRDDCEEVRYDSFEWVTPTPHDRCVAICEDLDKCGLINPPATFDVQGCIDHCPWAYVVRHSQNYKVGECNGYDRTAFEHITVGLQVLFREIGIFIPPLTIKYTDRLFELDSDYQYRLKYYAWELVDPPVSWALDGRYGPNEMYLSRALSHFFMAFLLNATSVNLEVNFPALDINYNYSHPESVQDYIQATIRFVEILLYDPIFPLGFQLLDEDWVDDQIFEGGQEFGRFFGAIADMFDYMFSDPDRQEGRAVGYNDDNFNLIWDPDETMTLRIDTETGVDITYQQAKAIAKFARAMEAAYIEREMLDVEVLRDVLESFNLGALDFVVDLLDAWFPEGKIDISKPSYEPEKNSFRTLLETVLEKLRIVDELMTELDL